jgi:EAL domain-containing protein (putative c-di-GMP-specific phosphodiesterase class I)
MDGSGMDAAPHPPARGRDARLLGSAARLAAFAFASADLLAEVTLDGIITFAAGAYRTRLGAPPESFIGQRVHRLVAPGDRGALHQGLAALAARGRLAPMVLRLCDAEATPVALSGLGQPGPGDAWHLCLTFGPLPTPTPPEVRPAPLAILAREAAARLGESGQSLDLIELDRLPPMQPAELAARIADVLRYVARGALVGEIAPGRYGLLREGAFEPGEPARLARAAQGALRAEGLDCDVEARALALDEAKTAGIGQALRCALAAYARDGWRGLAENGFESGLAGFLERSLTRRGELRRQIAERRFAVVYQPIVGLADGRTHHWEALIRPENGGTQEFVLAAEAAGLATELDLTMLDAVLAEARAAPGQRIAVNLSALSLQSPSFRERLLARLDAEPGVRECLAVEVTETAELDAEGEAAATAEGLRARGVPFCIDDFGAGAAAFRHLRALHADIVKVDGAYVNGAAASERDRAFVAAMVDLSLAVGAQVVAEQVETEAVAAVMRDLGVAYGQGWLFGRPGPLPEALGADVVAAAAPAVASVAPAEARPPRLKPTTQRASFEWTR